MASSEDREDRRRGRRGGETIGDERRHGFQPAAHKFERLAEHEIEHDDRRQKEDAAEDCGPDEMR